MRRLTLFPFLFVCGCATGGATQASPDRTPLAIYQSPETGTLFANRQAPNAVSIDAPPPMVWIAVKKVYADLEIPVTIENTTSHQIGNDNVVKTRKMAGKLMTAWIDCGSSLTGKKPWSIGSTRRCSPTSCRTERVARPCERQSCRSRAISPAGRGVASSARRRGASSKKLSIA